MTLVPQKLQNYDNLVYILTLQNANIPESGEEVDNERVMKNSEKICKELVWYMTAIGNHTPRQLDLSSWRGDTPG